MVYDYEALSWFVQLRITHLDDRGIIGFDFVPELVEDLVTAVPGTGKRCVANEGGEGPHTHQQPGDVHQRQQEEVPEAPPSHDDGDQPPSLRRVLRRPHSPPTPRNTGLPPRRRRGAGRAAASTSTAGGLTVSSGFGFHNDILSPENRERKRELFDSNEK